MRDAPKSFRELAREWRKVIEDCPPGHRGQWAHVFDATRTLAEELEGLCDEWEQYGVTATVLYELLGPKEQPRG